MAFPAAAGAGGPAPMGTGEFGAAAPDVPPPNLGSYETPEGRRSARLALKKFANNALVVVKPPIPDDAMSYLVVPDVGSVGGGGSNRMRGGDLTEQQRNGIAAITTAALITAALAYKVGTDGAVAVLAGSGGAIAILSSIAEGKTKAAGEAIGEYLKKRGAGKIAESGATTGVHIISLLDNALALTFSVLRLPLSLTTAAAGITGKLIGKGAEKIQDLNDKLEKPKTHEDQADLIIQNGTLAFAAALTALAASGALPLMTIFSVMLWTGKLYMSPVGRAVAVVELYMWWINNADKHAAIEKEVKDYVAAAKSGTGKAREWVEKTGAPGLKTMLTEVGGKMGIAGQSFVDGFKEGSAMENPVFAALGLGMLRAVGLAIDKNAPKPTEQENKEDLGKLAANILDNAIKLGPDGRPATIDTDKLTEAIANLQALVAGQKEIDELRAKLARAKEARGVALKNLTDVEDGDGGGGAEPPPPVATRAVKAAKSPTERTRAGPKAAAVAARGSEARAAGEAAAPRAAAEALGAVASAVAPVAAEKRRAKETAVKRFVEAERARRTGAAGPAGGARRKTRRKRFARRKTKKTITGFYY